MRSLVCSLIAIASFIVVSPAQAADVGNFLIAKGQEFRQTNGAAPVQISSEAPFRAVASVSPSSSGAVTGATLRLPNSQIVTLEEEGDGVFEGEAAFTSKALLDAQAGQGLYNFTIFTLNDGTNRPALRLPADTYPTTPHIANWQDAQDVESAFPFTLKWDPFTNGTATDYIVLSLEHGSGDDFFSTPFLLETNVITGTNTSTTIEAGTLDTNQTYEARLLFVKGVGINTTNIPGATGLAGYYKETKFPLVTLPEPPPAGRLQFSTRNFSALENDGPAVVTITRSGSQGTVSVDLATSNGSATDGVDYSGGSTTLSFDDGVTSTNIAVTLLDDFLLEGNETVNLWLSSPTGGAELGSRSNAVLAILDNEKAGAGILQFNPAKVSVTEPTSPVNVTITRIGGTAGTVTVGFHTIGGTAISDADFASTNGTMTFGPGISSKTIPIRILNDTLDETNETFSVVLDAPTGGAALGSNTTAQLTITDEDLGGTLAFSTATFTTNEFGSFALISVARVGGSASDVTVDFATQDGTAIAGLDYYATNGALTFGSNEMKKSFTVLLTNDLEFETNETVALSLSNPTGGAKLGTLSNATLRILDDEAKLAFTNANYTIGEAGLKLNINVVRTGARITPVTVNFSTADVLAVSTNDYRGTNGTLTFPPNVGFKTISIPIANDTVVESNETFTVALSNPQGGVQLGDLTNTTATITENDLGGVLSFSITNYTATEAGKFANVIINRASGKASGVTVDFTTTDGTATEGLDYTNATRTVTFNANDISKTVQVPIINDTLDEANETVMLWFSNPQGGASLGVRSNATITITDDDIGGAIALSSASYVTNENNPFFLITVTRGATGKASGVTVDFTTQDGVALADSDYFTTNGTLTFGSNEVSKVVTVALTNDTLPEGNETFSFHLSNPTGRATLGAISNATLTIRDDESSVAFTNVAYTVTEAGPGISVNVIRSGALITPVTVDFSTLDGSAVSTNDYRGTNGTLIFPINTAFKTITIPLVNDTIVEGGQAFSIFLHSPSNGLQLGTLTNTVVNIADNDLGGVFNFKSAIFVTNESNNAVIGITRTNGAASGVSVTFTTQDGSATEGLDYTPILQTVIFGAGQTSTNIIVPILNDPLDETNETVQLFLSNAAHGATVGVVSNATLTINDDDSGGVFRFASSSYVTNENADAFLVNIVRSGGVASSVTVSFFTQDGTATTAQPDYTATNDTLTFGAGETNKFITVPINNDTLPEGNETLSIILTNATGGATISTTNTTTLTIVDDESSVSFTNVTYTVDEAGPSISVNAVRAGALVTAVTVDFTILNGTAFSPGDYSNVNGTLSFPANTAVRSIVIPIVNDTIVEGGEAFSIFLHSPSNGLQLGTLTNTVVNIADNDLGGIVNFKSATSATNEANNATITITRTNGAASGVSVTLSAENGSATSPADFTAGSQTVIFSANQTSTNVVIPIVNDTLDETNETVNLSLSNVQNGATLGVVSNAVHTILDDDSAGVIQFNALSYTTNEGAGLLIATVIRTNGLASGVTVDYLTQDGTATAGSDYTNKTGSLTFLAGETNKTIEVGLIDDTVPDGAKSFNLLLTNATGGAILGVRSNATFNITDDENSVVIESATYVTNESAGAISVRVLRSGVLTSVVSVQISTANDTAVSPSDYVATNRTLNFPAGSSVQTVTIPIVNDQAIENTETFTVSLNTPTGGVQIGSTSNAVVTITDDDTAGAFKFSASTYAGSEGTVVNISVQRTGGAAAGTTVQFSMVNGTASSNDYSNRTQMLIFAGGETNKNIAVNLNTDNLTESVETVTLSLLAPTGGATLGSPNTATLNINNASGITCPPVTFNLTGPGMKASAFTGTVNGSLVSGILTVTGIEAGTTTKTIQILLSTVPAGSTGAFPMSSGSDFFGYSSSVINLSTFCSTTKTYNSDSPSSGCINIIEWDTANKRFRATFNFTAHGVDCGTTCAGGPDCATPTDVPSITGGQVWVDYIQSP